jgi:hypothetical protein
MKLGQLTEVAIGAGGHSKISVLIAYLRFENFVKLIIRVAA